MTIRRWGSNSREIAEPSDGVGRPLLGEGSKPRTEDDHGIVALVPRSGGEGGSCGVIVVVEQVGSKVLWAHDELLTGVTREPESSWAATRRRPRRR